MESLTVGVNKIPLADVGTHVPSTSEYRIVLVPSIVAGLFLPDPGCADGWFVIGD